MLTDPKNFIAPWADHLSDGTAIEYGPSAVTHARRAAEHANWAWRGSKLASQLARSPLGDKLRAYMRPDGRHLRADVPKREQEVYMHVFEHGRSVRWVAKRLELHRGTVRTYVERLKTRAGVG